MQFFPVLARNWRSQWSNNGRSTRASRTKKFISTAFKIFHCATDMITSTSNTKRKSSSLTVFIWSTLSNSRSKIRLLMRKLRKETKNFTSWERRSLTQLSNCPTHVKSISTSVNRMNLKKRICLSYQMNFPQSRPNSLSRSVREKLMLRITRKRDSKILSLVSSHLRLITTIVKFRRRS